MNEVRSTVPVPQRPPVIVGIDDREASGVALAYAARVAVARQSPLRVVHAYQSQHPGPETMLLQFADPGLVAMSTLGAACRHASALVDGQVPVVGRVRHGDAVGYLVEESHGAALVVVGHHHRAALAEMPHRAVAPRVAARAYAPVAVVPQCQVPTSRREVVTVGVDVPSYSRAILREAFTVASAEHLDLRVLHLWRLPLRLSDEAMLAANTGSDWTPLRERERRDALDVLVGDVSTEFPDVTVRIDVGPGVASKALTAASESSAVVVIGRPDPMVPSSRRVPSPPLASVAAHLLRTASCPVLIVPPLPSRGRAHTVHPRSRRETAISAPAGNA